MGWVGSMNEAQGNCGELARLSHLDSANVLVQVLFLLAERRLAGDAAADHQAAVQVGHLAGGGQRLRGATPRVSWREADTQGTGLAAWRTAHAPGLWSLAQRPR